MTIEISAMDAVHDKKISIHVFLTLKSRINQRQKYTVDNRTCESEHTTEDLPEETLVPEREINSGHSIQCNK